MNTALLLSVSAGVFLAYWFFRQFAEQNASIAAYRREIRKLMTEEKY